MVRQNELEILGQFDVISFDIFDTLLLRPFAKPTDVWLDIEEREGAKGFFDARQKADRKTYRAATKRGGEHTIDEVYALMGSKWKSFKEIELDYERRSLVGNPKMIEVWKYAGELGKKRVIISDMYVGEDWLKNTLRQNGIDGWDGFYLSSKVQKRKSTGELYKVMKRDFGDAKYLHFGDNEWSDVNKAEDNGVVAIRCSKVIDCAYEDFPFLRKFLERRPSLDHSSIVGALAIGWSKCKFVHHNFTFWNKIGFMFGGVLGYSYVRWIIGRCKARGIDHLMFVGRDGYIWQKIARTICPEINSDYFYAPRTISVRVLGTTLNADYKDVCDDRRRFADEYCTEDDEDHARQRYEAYIRRFDIDPKRTALVDGMSSQFSAQRLVEKVVGCELLTFYLTAYSQPYSGEAYILSKNFSICFQGFSEYIFGSPEPPIIDMCDAGPVFKSDIDPFEKIRMSVCEEICKGALESANVLHSFNALVSPEDWEAYYDDYKAEISEEDLANFEIARISTDVNHVNYRRIMAKGLAFGVRWWTLGHRLNLWGHPVFRVRSYIDNGVRHKSLWLFGKIPLMRSVERIYAYAKVDGY